MSGAQPSEATYEVFIVDDDPVVHEALSAAFQRNGFRVTSFSDGNAFLAAAIQMEPACVLLDVSMPVVSGLDVLKKLVARHYPSPIVMLSGKRDVPIVVEAIKNGALDFIEKPFDADAVVTRVREALTVWTPERGGAGAGVARRIAAFDTLTARERIVLAEIATGVSNKHIGRNLGISRRTVEVHRAHIMEKLGAKNAVDLMRLVLGGDNAL
jgi:FixJ family two-component response regulator